MVSGSPEQGASGVGANIPINRKRSRGRRKAELAPERDDAYQRDALFGEDHGGIQMQHIVIENEEARDKKSKNKGDACGHGIGLTGVAGFA